MIRKRGWLDDADVDAFLEAGFTKASVFDVLIGIADQSMSNYANNLIKTPLDPFSTNMVWKKPA